MPGSVRRFFEKIVPNEQLHVEIIEPHATDISQIEVETTDEMIKRRNSRERRRKALTPQTAA